jgi:uncharacterized protein (TIGR03083 family)
VNEPDPDISPELGALLDSINEQPPSTDVADVVRAALAARAALPLQPAPGGDEVAAFGRAVDDVRRTLGSLAEAHWALPAVNGLTVGELVGHLIGTQQAMAAELGLSASTSHSDDHIEMTRHAVDAARSMTPMEAADAFANASRVVTRHLATLSPDGLSAPARFGPVTADVRFLLIGRVFELWTHDNDLRAAVGMPRVEPDRERLWMMTRAAMPFVRLLSNPALRVVLTGPGGGVWPAEGDEVGEVVADSAAFCRRIANRISVRDVRAEVSGDAGAANAMLEAIAALALD